MEREYLNYVSLFDSSKYKASKSISNTNREKFKQSHFYVFPVEKISSNPNFGRR